jgi:indole-3-glycerol phosphate synthase
MPLPGGQLLIAEAKHHSPFAGSLGRTFEELFELIEPYGDILSILIDPRWNGKLEHLRWARQRTRKPLLAKGMFTTDVQVARAFDGGADYVLAYDFLPTVRPERCLVEPSTINGFASLDSKLMVWNARDLKRGGKPKPETWEQALEIRSGQWLCQASYLQTLEDVHPAADAVLVGTQIESFIRSLGEVPVLPPELWP